MKPTLLVGDYLFVSKYSYGYSKLLVPFSLNSFSGRLFGSVPERGDVVVFNTPATNRPTTSSASSACPATASR